MVKDIVKVPVDYSFELNYEFLTRSTKEILHLIEGESIYKVIKIFGDPVLLNISPSRRAFVVTYPDVVPSAELRKAVVQYVKEWFDLENDLSEFYDLARKDKLLQLPVEQFYGYRIVGMPDLFEALCWAVIGQQINLSFAYTLKRRFVENFGERFKFDGKEFYLFPEPEVVAQLTDEHLLPLQFSRQKSKYLTLIAEAFLSKTISKEYIRSLPFPEARQKLMSIKGVGNWSANYALMKTFRYREAFPLEDAGLHNAIRIQKKMKQKPTVDQVKRIFRKYKGWEAYATLYLWKTL